MDTSEAKTLRDIARRCIFADHYNHRRPDPENCGSCALVIGGPEGPNYAGWARVYVEAGVSIPAKWRKAFEAERARTDNPAYTKKLEEVIAHFGVTFTK